ncbi:hypothetical protein STENM327S_02197 [Streptomyces tendae]
MSEAAWHRCPAGCRRPASPPSCATRISGDRRDGSQDASDDYADFTAERAASSLAGFQRGTLRAQTDEDTADAEDTGTGTDGHVFSSAAPTTPTADRRPPTKDTR